MTPILNINHILIRALQIDDLDAFAQYRNCESIARYQSWENYTLEDAQKLLQSTDYSTFGKAGNWYQLAVIDSQSEQLLGDLAVHFIDDQQVEIGFTIAPEHQGLGIAFQSVRQLLSYLFLERNTHRVIAITDADNLASRQLLTKLGFRKEAHFVKNILFKGKWGDECLFAMLQDEYTG
ncbi:hypothetical protein PSECIP111951_02132 [Pseudoalteromonas holothuriae]|uniref:N-acetyltransferase domain-containing protein n=1 Tax=Pseudoalteromonas holothuriae TaxID=2963714 RepID=A0ABN8ULL9_9GAMM|nr:GNAT family protein [Pseudoalteromonas sp. CIP111951]CAH9059744.1 hypothetical protein PSECIP111951_02132 [Pseudoalteromonas sp. CIP111951]